MSIINAWLKRDFFLKAAFLYLGMMFVIGIIRPNQLPPMPILAVQILYVLIVLVFSHMYSIVSLKRTLFCIFLFQLICSLGLRYFNYSYYHNPLGFNAVDSAFYDMLGGQVNLPYREFVASVLSYAGIALDDVGFPTVIYVVYKLCGDYGGDALVFFNTVIITWSCYFLYKTSMMFFDNKKSLFICFFWGIEAFAIKTAAGGLKENFFLFFVVAAMYYLCKLSRKICIKDLLLFLLFAIGTYFFRMTIFYGFVVTFFVVLFLKNKSIKINFWFLAFLILLIVVVNVITIVKAVMNSRGYSIDRIEIIQEDKGSGLLQWVTNIVAALIGPFPNFISSAFKRNYITLYSFTPFAKMLYSLFFLYGTWYALKKKKTEYFPFILMWGMNTIMIVVMFFALHDRFQWPHIPFTLILSCLGYDMLQKNKSNEMIQSLYLIVVVLFIFIFNFRS